jgi:membrane protein implicated in regulation of membrane protease activity
MAEDIRLLDVVALTEDLSESGLVRGQVGTVVEILSEGNYEVEFSGDDGRAYALLPLASRQLMVLRYQPARAA